MHRSDLALRDPPSEESVRVCVAPVIALQADMTGQSFDGSLYCFIMHKVKKSQSRHKLLKNVSLEVQTVFSLLITCDPQTALAISSPALFGRHNWFCEADTKGPNIRPLKHSSHPHVGAATGSFLNTPLHGGAGGGQDGAAEGKI